MTTAISALDATNRQALAHRVFSGTATEPAVYKALDYGTTGDMAAAIRAAVAAAEANSGGIVTVPPGAYNLSSTATYFGSATAAIPITGPNVTLVLLPGCVLTATTAMTTMIGFGDNGTTLCADCKVEGGKLNGASSATNIIHSASKVDDLTLDGVEVIGGTATAVVCAPNNNQRTASSITGSGTTATVTLTSHGYTSGDFVVVAGVNEKLFAGVFEITVTGVDTFTYEALATLAASATGTLNVMRANARHTYRDLYVHDVQEGVVDRGFKDHLITGCRVVDMNVGTPQDCIEPISGSGMIISDCLIGNPGTNNSGIDIFAIQKNDPVENIVITGCVFDRTVRNASSPNAITLTVSGGVTDGNIRHIAIVGNTFRFGWRNGVHITSNAPGTNDILIANNIGMELDDSVSTRCDLALIEDGGHGIVVAGNIASECQGCVAEVGATDSPVAVLNNFARGGIDGNGHIFFTGDPTAGGAHLAKGNVLSNQGARDGAQYAIAANADGRKVRMVANDAIMMDGSTNYDEFFSRTTNGTNYVARDNAGYNDRAKGTGTIPNGSTTVAVTHGIGKTPGAAASSQAKQPSRIRITATNNPTNAAGLMYYTISGNLQFTVGCRNNPGVSGLTFSWEAEI